MHSQVLRSFGTLPWLAGQNLADSGGDSGVIDIDEVAFTAV